MELLYMYTVVIEVPIMPRRSDIIPAFLQAIHVEPSGRRIVTTGEFLRQLAAVNFDWTLEQANEWIQTNTRNFRDITPHHGGDKLWFMFNPNGGL
ncbi:DNA polymerase V [Kosakonia sacchari]|uniref:DNA polymerase V n=1 Tax=Kosakonia sacchari TaxID=1158459 RepID=UPI002ACD4C0A|nr:DNA polymerase V [Kosakonia sacchari]MDZ7320769.1 DNA polymerase V [Kosakonia sacchari]